MKIRESVRNSNQWTQQRVYKNYCSFMLKYFWHWMEISRGILVMRTMRKLILYVLSYSLLVITWK